MSDSTSIRLEANPPTPGAEKADAGPHFRMTADRFGDELTAPRVDGQLSEREIEFAGWLPAFRQFGNCGSHPQFSHTSQPPVGYRFVEATAENVSAWNLVCGAIPAFGQAVRLSLDCLRDGAGLRSTWQFLKTRHFRSQCALSRSRRPVFLTSVPFTLGQYPWMIEIEDSISLFFPFVHNGRTAGLRMTDSPCFRPLRTLLEAPQCRAIVTHIRSTAESLPRLFDSTTIEKKTHYVPLGLPLPTRMHASRPSESVALLFSNSWHQGTESFYIRGGLDVLEAFDRVAPKFPHARLTLRTALPTDLAPRYRRIIERNSVRVLDGFMPDREWAELRESSHVYLLPSDRIHIVSILQAMGYGMAVIASDGWGMQEYVDHLRNGWVVSGRYGKITWCDEATGALREDYAPMRKSDPDVVDRLAEAMSRLIEDEPLRTRLGQTARADVETRFSLANWNAGLKRVFDACLPPEELP